GAGGDLTGIHLGVSNTDGGDLRAGEHGGGDGLQADRRHTLAECVVHRDTALHGRHRGQGEQIGAVTRGVDTGHGGTRNTVNLDVTRRGEFDTDVLQAEVLGVRDGTDRHQRVGAVDLTTVGGTHAHTTIRGAGDRIHAGVLLPGNTAFREDGLQAGGGVRIIVGQAAVT